MNVSKVSAIRGGDTTHYHIAAIDDAKARLTALRLEVKRFHGWAKADVPKLQYFEIRFVCALDAITK